MTEVEFNAWQYYAARKMLPQRRLELYLAQIAYYIHGCVGGARNRRIADYMFDPADSDAEPTAEEEADFFGFNPIGKE